MYSSNDEIYIEAMTDEIELAITSLIPELEKVPETGLFAKITTTFKDKSGKLDITEWQLSVCTISKIDGGNENKRYLEVSGKLKSGYKISCFNFCGTKQECIEILRNTYYVEKVKHSIRVNLNGMDD